jgi:hypothetical protein
MAHPAQRMIDAARRYTGTSAAGGTSSSAPTQQEADSYGLVDNPGRPGVKGVRQLEDEYNIQRAKERAKDNWGAR